MAERQVESAALRIHPSPATRSRSVSHKRAWLSKMSVIPLCTAGEFNACVLMALWASRAPMMAFNSSFFRSGELANCSFVLLVACC